MPRNNSLTNICEACGKEFHPHYGYDNAKYCTTKCYLSTRWGERSPQFCAYCGKEFFNKNRGAKYCSHDCSCKASVGSKKPHKDGRETRFCEWCGEEITRSKSSFHGEKAFCSTRCMAEWQSEFVTGDEHPRWKGGEPRSYGIGWKAAKRQAIVAAGGKCAKCKKSAKLEVHHILPIRYFEKNEYAHSQSNLIALCQKCHDKEHAKLADAMPLLDLLQFKSGR